MSDSSRQELARAFQAFNALSDQLKTSYVALERRVAALTAELEQARREREREAETARRLADRLQQLLSTLPVGVVVVDVDGNVQQVNPAAESILGTAPLGRSWAELTRQVFVQGMSANGDWLRGDGRQVSMLTSALDERQTKVVVMTDVSDMRAIEQLVNRNDRLRAMGKMAASLAHQIRTPLASALLYLSQCRQRSTDAEQLTLLSKTTDRMRDLDHLVQDMLVFARGHGPGQ
ncbi:MAG: histidine kinase dimerization/phospho-acceptor domain-containing protein, partial [Gammaproteobacteria bacterium]|nr:histidine kinase dimerization/phospho-acceptor domain-containing protein [Gammaproteobacteria bacterium]